MDFTVRIEKEITDTLMSSYYGFSLSKRKSKRHNRGTMTHQLNDHHLVVTCDQVEYP